MYKKAKKLVAEEKYSSISELLRAGLRRTIEEADIIITAVGKKVLAADMLKNGVILANVGLRHERGKLKGDYDEKEIKSVASYYTPTPKGIGPIDVLYLFKNLIDAAEFQKK